MNRSLDRVRRAITWVLIVSVNHAAIVPVMAAQPIAPIQPLPVAATGNNSYVQAGTTGTVTQTASKQTFGWTSFDIGQGYKVIFNQPNSGVALNRIGGGRPSEIRGALQSVTPDGKGAAIYLINNNGIIFGATAQVNVGSLVASTFDVDDNLFQNSSIADAINQGQPAFVPIMIDNQALAQSEVDKLHIDFEAGAKIHTEGANGVMVFAPNIVNKGTIETPDGQAILAASRNNKVYLTPATAAKINDQPLLRGFLVEVDSGGTVENLGQIVAERGNITLLGMAVNQNGRLTATTAAGVGANGSIRLLARDHAIIQSTNQAPWNGDPTQPRPLISGPLINSLQSANVAVPGCTDGSCKGSVTFGKNSVTEVLPDTQTNADGSAKTQPDVALQSPSVIEVAGKNIALADGAQLHAPAGIIQIAAVGGTDASITLGANAKIDVSGTTDTVKNVQDNVLDIKLVGTELADVPLQRNGVLSRANVKVDATLGTSVANISGSLDNIQRTASERLANGGSVSMTANNVALDPSSLIDVSGGKVTYLGGNQTTTYLHGGGKWTEISKANPNMVYDKIQDVTRHKVQGYVDGKDAGSITIAATNNVALSSGVLKGGVVIGEKQRDNAPKAGTLTLSTNTPVSIVSQGAYRSGAGQIVDQLFKNSGLGNVDISANGLTLAADAELKLASRGRLSVTTTQDIDVDGKIHIAGGSVALNNSNSVGDVNTFVNVGNHGVIDVSGTWINERLNPSLNLAHIVDAGDINIKSGNISLLSGSLLEANGGALLNSSKKLTAGTGGDITLSANYAARPQGTLSVGKLQLDGALQSYSLTQGGKLALTANGFIIDRNAAQNVVDNYTMLAPEFFQNGGFSAYSLINTNSDIRIAANTSIDLIARNWQIDSRLYGTASGTDISAYATVTTLPDYLRKPVSFSAKVVPDVITLQVSTPKLVVEKDARISTDPGGQISLESQTLQLLIDGKLIAPGGAINLLLDPTFPTSELNGYRNFYVDQAIVLGANAELHADATFIANPVANHTDFLRYISYGAGSVNLTAKNGYIVAEQGSRISVDGAAQTVDINQVNARGVLTRQRIQQAADAGTIHLQSAEGMLLDGAILSGKAAVVAGAKGGRLEVVLDTNKADTERLKDTHAAQTAASTIHVQQSLTEQNFIASPITRTVNGIISGISSIYSALTESSRGNNSVVLSANAISAGGFDQLQLAATNTQANHETTGQDTITPQQIGRIQFDGDVDLSLRQSLELNTNSLVVNNGTVHAAAPYLLWSSDADFTSAFRQKTLTQTGADNSHLTLGGDFIDLVGTLTTVGVHDTTIASSGDIRARDLITVDTTGNVTNRSAGSLTTYGDLTLQAQQIYPPTAHQFSFAVNGDANATLNIQQQPGTPQAVLSAGGSLAFTAPNIIQGGTVKAPLGSITMTAMNSLTLTPESLTSVALDSDVPYGLLDLLGNWSVAIPNKSITLQAPSIAVSGNVDLRGGGDVYEYQFIAGPGGSKDVLLPANSGNSFAIVPTLNLLYAPLNDLDSSSVTSTGWAPGQTLTLNRNGVAQNYAVLPARYAMLPGAMLVTPTQKYDNAVAPGYSLTQADGSVVVAGKIGYASTNNTDTPAIQSSLWSAYTLQTRDQVLASSQYNIKTATQYFKQSGTSSTGLPADGGFLKILAQADVLVAGTIRAAGADGGRSGGLDLQASAINVVHALSNGAHSGVEILDSQLNNLAVDSILLGGSRQFNATSTTLTTAANTATVADNAVVTNKEILFAAKDSIQIHDNASIVAAGGTQDTSGKLETINVAGQGTVLRLSSVRQADIERTGANASLAQGTLAQAQSATLRASNIAVDVSHAATLGGVIDAQGGSLAFSAPQISIGAGATSGLVLQQAQVNNSALQQLILNSSSSIDFYSPLAVSASDNVSITASAIRSFINLGDAIDISAGKTIALTGRSGSPTAATGTNGQLNLTAPQITLNGSKDSAITTNLSTSGFNQIALNASDRVTANGNLNIDASSPISITTPLLTSADGANFALTATGAVAINGGSGADTKNYATGSFGSVKIKGDSVALDTSVVLPGGLFTAQAAGADGINFGDHAQTDVAGRTLTIGNQKVAVDGGSIALLADSGAIATTAQSHFDVSASDDNANAGSISITSPHAVLNWLATAVGKASADHRGGSLSIDAGAIGNIGALFTQLSSGGFNDEITLRQRTGDMSVAANDQLHAHAIDLQVDNGNLDMAGTLSADGAKTGSINLAAGNNLILRGTTTLSATATDAAENGGKVMLSARDGYLDLQDGSTINLNGGANGAGGTLDMRVSRTQSDSTAQGYHNITSNDIADVGDGVAIQNYGVTVNGARRIDIEAVKTYVATAVSTVIATAQSDTAAFMSAVDGWATQKFANVAAASKPRIVPGVEIDSSSDLAVDTPIDLYDFNSGSWRYSSGGNTDIPGVLTFRAVGNLQISNFISDGFNQDTTASCISNGICSGLAAGSSWSLNLVAGADTTAASVLATQAESHADITLGSGVYVRTGTGNLNVAASGSLLFADSTAALYTSGSATPLQQQINGVTYGYDGFLGELLQYLPDYPVNGGDVSVRVGENIAVNNAVAPMQSADWLFRYGGGEHPATWGVVPEFFSGGIATLGGGNIDVRAGGNVTYVQIAAPTTGKQLAQTINENDAYFLLNKDDKALVEINGGGDVSVRAAGDIASSNILVSKGKGIVRAGGGLIQAGAQRLANLFGIGDATIDVTARNGIAVEAVYNPTVAIQSAMQVANNGVLSEFFTYGRDAAISLRAATGDILLKNDSIAVRDSQAINSSQGSAGGGEVLDWTTVLPGKVTGIAVLGDITIKNNLTLFPAADGNLVLAAGGNVTGTGSSITLGDGDASRLPSLGPLQTATPFSSPNIYSITALSEVADARNIQLDLTAQILGQPRPGTTLNADAHTTTPLHSNDFSVLTLAAGGDISNVILNSPKAIDVVAGGDITGATFTIQNIRAGDVSEVVAGQDILESTGGFVISGPGRFDLLAGRDIDLGISQTGVQSVGNIINRALSDTGATISLWAGLGKNGPDYKGYIDKYIPTGDLLNLIKSSDFGGDFITYVKALTQRNYTQVSAAIADWQALPSATQQDVMHAFVDGNARYLRPLIQQSYFAELKNGGINGHDHVGEGYASAYRAIDTLFPTSSLYKGDISLVKSSLQSNAGGDINFIVPNGKVDVGLPVSGGATVNVQGIVVSDTGNINGYVSGDINVNRSKVITQNGGDILLFSRFGSIDAGRGARTALVLPPPTIIIDPQTGNVIVHAPPAISGNGIQAGCSNPKGCKREPPQSVYLFAPNGVIDAGDAGISSAGNIFLDAQQVLHADVISAAGSVVGAPAAPTPDIGLGAGDVAASAVQSAQETVANAANGNDKGALGERGLALLTVDILGYGSSQEDDDKRKRN